MPLIAKILLKHGKRYLNKFSMKCESLSGYGLLYQFVFLVLRSALVNGILPCDYHKQIMYELQTSSYLRTGIPVKVTLYLINW